MVVSNVKVSFSIIGDYFNPDIITDKLNIVPTETRIKGEILSNGKSFGQTEWSIETLYEESYDINQQLEKIVTKIRGKEEVINEICKFCNTKCLFMIVVNIENNEKPAMYFNKGFIHLMDKIGAEVGFDLYIYS